MDSILIPKGLKRCSLIQFVAWLGFVSMFLGAGGIGALLVFGLGLNQTGLNDYFGFGLWITLDLAIIALGAGAFFTGFLTYILKIKELKAIINFAVVIGFICYSGAIVILGLDVGQPLRAWFGYWHPNIHSMLTEVMFCITCYLTVLMIEYLPLLLENRKLDEIPLFHNFSHSLHEIMMVFAGVGTFLSFFHQGSLGGMYGVLFARPFLYRPHFFIWPTSFFLFILSAIASGPAFTVLITSLTQLVTGKKLVKRSVFTLMAKISGIMLSIYITFKIIDTWYWAKHILPDMGLTLADVYAPPYSMSLLFAELIVCGVLPAILLLIPKVRENDFLLYPALLLNILGIIINRFVFTVQGLAIPVMPFDSWQIYLPSWQEWVTTIAVIAYGAIVVSLSFRYMPIFPQEKELN